MKPKPPAAETPIAWETDALDWSRTAGHADRLLAAVDIRKKRQRRRRRKIGGAAAVVFIGLLCWINVARPDRETALVATGTHTVTTPERRMLPDGSTVELKPGAAIVVNFSASSAGSRSIELTKGEVLFQVEKDPARPFVVTAGGIQFRAIGTAFTVDVRASSVEMLVTEGRVSVEKPVPTGTAVADSIATVGAGHRVELAFAQVATAEVVPTSSAETAEKLAWRVPRIEFNETPLWKVVSLLNQHSSSKISLASDSLGRLEISGALRADNIEPLLSVLESNYNIQVVRSAGREIELRQLP